MGRNSQDEAYLSAFSAAIAQRDQIFAEFEQLKNRRILLETAARTLEPLVYPDEYLNRESNPPSSTVIEISRPAPSADLCDPALPVEVIAPVRTPEEPMMRRPVQAVTQIYVRGEGEPDDEIQRRINIAIGRSAAD